MNSPVSKQHNWLDASFSEKEASLERAGRVDELIRLYEARAKELPGPQAMNLWTKAGQLAWSRAKDVTRAEALFRCALLADPSALEPWSGLRGLLEQKQDFVALGELLERMASQCTHAEAAALYLKAADLYEQKLGRKDRLLLCLQWASKATPQDPQLYRRIRQLLISENRFEAALGCILREHAHVGSEGLAEECLSLAQQLLDDPTERAWVVKALALAEELSAPAAKVEALRKSLNAFEGTWREHVRSLRTASLEERDRKKAARLSLKIAKLFAWYDSPTSPKVKEALDRSFLLWPAMGEGLLFLERLAEKLGNAGEAVGWMEKMALEAKERSTQVDLWLRVGTLRLQQNDRAGALAAFERASQADGSRSEPAALAAELLFEDGKHPEGIALLEKHLSATKDRLAQANLHQRIANLYLRGLGDVRSAISHLERALSQDPSLADAAFQLTQLHLQQGDAALAQKHLDTALMARRTSAERMGLLEAVALGLEGQGEHKKAFSILTRGLFIEPTRPLLVGSILEQAQKAEAHEELAALLQRAATLAEAPASTVLWRSLAQLLENPLSRPAEAKEAWERVLGQAPADETATLAVKRLAQISARPKPTAPKDLETDFELHIQKLEASATDPSALLRLYQEQLARNPGEACVWKKLAAVASQCGQWPEAAKAYQALVELAPEGAEKREWRVRLAQVRDERLSQKEEAARIYLSLLEGGATSAKVVGPLERLASQGVHPVEISRALASHYAQTGDHQRQVASLLVQLTCAQGREQKKQLLSLLAQIHEHALADSRGAFDFFLRGLALDPSDSTFRAEAARLASDLSAPQELARFLIDLGSREQQISVSLALLNEAALWAERAGALKEAGSALALALERAPDDSKLWAQLVSLHLRAGDLLECDRILRRRLEAAPPKEKPQLYAQLCEVSERLGRPGEAAAALQEGVAAGLPEWEELPKLCELLKQAGRMTELAQALARHIELAEQKGEGDLVARLTLRRAQVVDASLGDKAQALHHYSEILEMRPSDPDALSALEHLLTDPSCRGDAARALVPAYQALKEHRKLVFALDAVAEATQDNLEKVLALKKSADVYLRHLRQPELAFATLARAMTAAPSDLSVRNAARQAAEAGDMLDAYADAVSELLEGQADALKVELYRELADVYEKKLGDSVQAALSLEKARALQPSDEEVLRGLLRLYRAAESWEPLAEILESLASRVVAPAEKLGFWREAGALYEQRLRNPEKAAVAWRQATDLDPLDREAASALERLYSHLDRPWELGFALELKRAQEGQSPQGREIAFRLAQLRQQRLSDNAGALQLYRQILAEDPGHAGARNALEGWARLDLPESTAALEILDPVLIQLGDHGARVSLRETQVEHALGGQKARLWAEIRAIYERDLAQPELAFLSAVKSFQAGWEAQSPESDMERLAKQTGNLDALAEVYERAVDSCLPGDPKIAPLLRRAAELREQLGHLDGAIRLWKDLLIELPQDREALENLGRLYEECKNAKSVSEIYMRQAQLAEDPQQRRSLLLKAGAAFEAAGEDERAIESFKAALVLRKSQEPLASLDRLYGKLHRTEEQSDVLDQWASVSDELSQRIELRLRRALLLEKDAGPGEAVHANAQVLELSPGNPAAVSGLERLLAHASANSEAARILEPVYRSVNDSKKLVEVLEIRVAGADAKRRAELRGEIVTLREALGQKSVAFAVCRQAFAENPGDDGVRQTLERLAIETGAFEALADSFQEKLEEKIPEPLALILWRKLAWLYGHKMSRLDLAAHAWEEVARRDPESLEPLEALASIYRRTHNLRELAAVMRRQVSLEPSTRAQVQLWFDLGNLAEEGLSDKALAAECYQSILEKQPDDINAMKPLARVLAESERWPELAALLQKQVEWARAQGAREEALDLTVRLGRLKLTRLSDARAALELFRAVVEERPEHAGALGALEELARSDSPLRGEAANALEPLFSSHGDHLKLVQMLEAQVSTEPLVQERVVLLHKIAELYEGPLQNPALAFVASTRALRERPEDLKSLELSLRLAQPAEATEELAAVLEEAAAKASDKNARAELLRAQARLGMQLDDFSAAALVWQALLEQVPSDAEALTMLAQLFDRQGRWNELVDILRRQLAVSEDLEERVSLLFQMAKVQEDSLGQNEVAAATLRRLRELRPGHAQALERLERLCERLERWPELADVLTARIETVSPGEAMALKFRLAQLREAKLTDKAAALALYAEIIEAEPAHPAVLAQLETWKEREPHNTAVLDALISAHRKTQDQEKLTRVLEMRAACPQDAWGRKSLLMELAGIRESQSQPEMAFLALFRAFKEDPNDAGLQSRLEKTAELAQTHEELAVAYEEELPRVLEVADAARICLKLATLLEHRLNAAGRAAVYYEKARELDPSLAPEALFALDRIYTGLGQPENLARVLAAEAEIAKQPSDKVAFLFRLGQLAFEQLASPERAMAALDQVIALDPTHVPAMRVLESLCEGKGDSQKLLEVLKLQKERASGVEKERVLLKMAQVSEQVHADMEGPLALYRELLEKNPLNEQAFSALEGLLESARRFDELKELLAQKLKHTTDPRELVRLNDRLGRVLLYMLQRPEEAISYFKAALDRDARHKSALEALLQIYETLSRREDLVMVLRRLVPLQDNAQGVKAIRLKLAEVMADMGRREEALDAARRALEIEPHEASELDRVKALCLGLKAFGEAVRALELRAELFAAAEDRDRALSTLFEIAELWRGPAGKPELGGPVLLRALEIDPAHRKAYELACALYASANDWRAYAQVVDRYLPHLVTEEDKVTALQDLARVHEQKLGQKDMAFMALCRAFHISPNVQEVQTELERLAEETQSFEELASVYEEVADSVPRGSSAEKLYLSLARIHDDKLDDASGAEGALRKILEFDPTNDRALDMLAAIFARRGQDNKYIVALEQKLETAASIEQRKQILREIARSYDERLGNLQEAAHALSRALELEPDEETLASLVALHRRAQQWQEAANTLLRARDLARTPEERGRIQLEVAAIYEREIHDDESAIAGYIQALEFDPNLTHALVALERVYTKLDRSAELLGVYQRQLELTQDFRERVKILFKSATIWEDKYQNLEHADVCIESVLDLDPRNLQALKTLQRLRRQTKNWEQLVAAIGRHIPLCTTPAEQADLFVAMGDVFYQELKQVDKAADNYQRALELNPACLPALHALGNLYERSGNWPFALEMLEREAQLSPPGAEAVELFHRMGKINEDMLMDPSTAQRHYEKAIGMDPAHLPSLRALKSVCQSQGLWEQYEKALIWEAERTEDPQEKGAALIEVARHYAQKREDPQAAAAWYEKALQFLPTSVEAATALTEIAIGREDWEKAEKMLDITVAGMAHLPEDAEGLAGHDLARHLYRLGYVCEKLGKKEKALVSYDRAYQQDATYLPALEGLGNLLVQADRPQEALKVYQTLLVHHREDLTDLEVVEVYWQLGELHQKVGQSDRAQNHFEKALAIDPEHEPSLRALVGLSDAAEKWSKSAEYRGRLATFLEGEDKFALCIDLGSLARDKLKDPYLASEAYLNALKAKPDALDVMDSLYQLYRETRQAAKAAELVQRMLSVPELQAQPNKAKKAYHALGEIARDELKDVDQAIEAFNSALDLDPRFAEAFSAIESLLSAQKQWKKLEENYARMIQRLPKTDETHAARMALWRTLGDLYLRKLKNNEGALMAYQVVASGLPQDANAQQIFGSLAAQTPGYEDKALGAFRNALAASADQAKACSAIAELAAKRKDYDLAYRAASAASGFLGLQGESEKEILTKLTPFAKKKEVAQKAVTDQLWRTHLLHPYNRGPLAELLAFLFQQVGHAYAASLTQYQINPKKHRIDVAQAQEYPLAHFRYAARLLGMETVELYSPFLVATRERLAKRSSEPAPEPMVGVEVCHSHPMCVKVGGKYLTGLEQKEAYWVVARHLALLRPELAFAQRLSFERLQALVAAAMALAGQPLPVGVPPETLMAERRTLERALNEPARAALMRFGKEYAKVHSPVVLGQFLDGAELSAVRAGFFVAGEAEAVKKMVMGETGVAFRISGGEKLRHLVSFAVSDDLTTLRQAAGVQLEVPVRR